MFIWEIYFFAARNSVLDRIFILFNKALKFFMNLQFINVRSKYNFTFYSIIIQLTYKKTQLCETSVWNNVRLWSSLLIHLHKVKPWYYILWLDSNFLTGGKTYLCAWLYYQIVHVILCKYLKAEISDRSFRSTVAI